MSEQTKHTPGPWHYKEGKYVGVYLLMDAKGEQIAAVGQIAGLNANLHAAAAAPELLESCEEINSIKDALMAFLMNHEDALTEMQLLNLVRAIGKRADTAIAKAKGATQC